MSEADTIFLLGREGALQEIPESPYDREDLLQSLIAQHPTLLAGRQIDEDDPPRWLLVCREMGVPGTEGGADRWSLDHLFLDQNGVPTMVEVKRASDTRIRREVVGQMLDYAANAQKYWPADRIRRTAEEQAGGAGPLTERLAAFLECADDAADVIEQFWQRVDANLRRGQLRLLFVADHIPSELRRIIEFLNDKMTDVHVVGLELVQYHRDGLRVMVPRVVGQTEAARDAKARAMGGGVRKTSREGFLAACPDSARPFFLGLLAIAEARGLRVAWGEKGFSVGTNTESHGVRTSFAYGFPPGANEFTECRLEVYLHRDAFPVEDRERWARRLQAIAPFRRGGQYTLRLAMNSAGVAASGSVLRVLEEIEAELRSRTGAAAR